MLVMAQALYGEDLHFKKNISVGGTSVSSSETWVKGARERTVTSSPTGNLVSVRQCDMERTLTISDTPPASLSGGLSKDADFLVVDASKPFSETSYFDIERAMLEGRTLPVEEGGSTRTSSTLFLRCTSMPERVRVSATAWTRRLHGPRRYSLSKSHFCGRTSWPSEP